jgi:hypothetical protein
VCAVAVLVRAWGWRPGLAATSFALTVSAYFSLRSARVPEDYQNAIVHLTLFALVAVLICWFNAELRSAQTGLRHSESNFRSLVTHALTASASATPRAFCWTPTQVEAFLHGLRQFEN